MVSSRRKLFFLFATSGVALLQALLLWQLPYTTSIIHHLPLAGVEQSQSAMNDFRLGELMWDIELYKADKNLHSFRQFFQRNCGTQRGLDAAICLSDVLLKKIPFGAPSQEVVDAIYSPIQAFENHMNGAPGHCVTYAGLSSLVLLASGTPARMVQIVSSTKPGHNVIEVWDAQHGWVLFDPLNKFVPIKNGNPISALEAINPSNQVTVAQIGKDSESKSYLSDYYQGKLPFDGAIVYPEPWLYTRSGKRFDHGFYRGRFVSFGIDFFWLGQAQRLLRLGILICFVLASISGFLLVRSTLHWGRQKMNYLRHRLTAPLRF